MTAYKKILKDNKGNQVLPKTRTDAVYDVDNNRLDQTLEDLKGISKENADKIGVLSELTNTVKTDLVSAINENKTNIDTNTEQINVLNANDSYENAIIKVTYGANVKIGCVGDSTTEGIGSTTTYPQYLQQSLKKICPYYYYNTVITNEGIAGDTTEKILNRIDNIIANNYDMIILSVGINDLAKIISTTFGYTIKDYKENMVKIIRKFRENGVQVLVLSPLPVCGGGINYSSRAMEIACRNICAQENVDYIDLRENYYNMFLKKIKSPVEFAADFIHPSEGGYKLMSDSIIKHIFKLPVVETGDYLPCYMSPFLCTDITTSVKDDLFDFKYATKITADSGKYFRMFFFCKDHELKLKAIVNTTKTGATVVPIFDFDYNYKVINVNSTDNVNNVVIDTGLTLQYGFNIVLIDPAQNNGDLEIQAFQVYKG